MNISIQEFTKDILNQINIIYQNKPEIFDIFNYPYNMPEFDPIRGEICKCLIFRLNIAAITSTNFLVEHFLKIALSYKYSLEKNKDQTSQNKIPINQYFQEGHGKYNSFKLYESIEEAFKQGIIDEEEKDQLHKQRDLLRNAYSHADKNKIFGDEKVPCQMINYEGNEPKTSEPESFYIVNLPFSQGILLKKHAEANALTYFKYIDSIIRRTIPLLFPETTERIKKLKIK